MKALIIDFNTYRTRAISEAREARRERSLLAQGTDMSHDEALAHLRQTPVWKPRHSRYFAWIREE